MFSSQTLFAIAALVILPAGGFAQDVVIVGGGIAGMAAATFLTYFSSLDGNGPLEIVLLESHTELGGALRIDGASGTFIPQTMDQVLDLERYIGEADPSLEDFVFPDETLEAMFNATEEAFPLLEQVGAVDGFDLGSNQPYYGTNDISGSTYYHAADRSPLEQVTARFIVFALRFLSGRGGQNTIAGIPRDSKGLLYQPSHVQRLALHVERLPNVDVRLQTAMTDLQQGDNETSWEVIGWDRQTEEAFSIDTQKVIFASGGYTANRAVMESKGLESMVPHSYNGINTGIIEEVATKYDWEPCPALQQETLPVWFSEAVELKDGTMQPLLFLNGDSLMTVNSSGMRVYNEKWSYARRGKVCFDNGHLILITDSRNLRVWNMFPPAGIPAEDNVFLPTIGNAKYIPATSVEDLTEQLVDGGWVDQDVFLENVSAQLQRFNEYAIAEVDEEFGRHLFDRTIESDDIPAMAPIDTEDLYAIILHPSTLDTCSGPKTSETTSRILQHSSLDPVDGVYAIGNAACSLTRGFYWSPGTPSWSAVVGAYQAAKDIASS